MGRCGGAGERGWGAGAETGGGAGWVSCFGLAGGPGGAGLETSGGAPVGAAGAAAWGSLGRGPGGCAAGAPGWSGCRRSRRNSSRSFMGSSGARRSTSVQYRLPAALPPGLPARPPFRLPSGLRKLGGAQLVPRHGAFGHACDSGGCARLRSVELLANSFKGLMWPASGTIHDVVRRLPTVEPPAARLSISRYSEFTVTPAGRLVLGKLACQAGFVISFYDLSRLVTSPPFSAARTNT